ncbi:CoA ester lyase [Agaricicola taiwanensis]|uniref:CoA ester lyase n=1 Tax=Agaricicola taiwanensis TaxID=591372 RepID=A0A8J3DVZ6_9RHOB|nr:CoA ester lyase [Agaricicola taiwanensis]GGE45860.1 CoA ester lyase [Agaricicola taiwanensis]
MIRSLLYIPASSERFIEKAHTRGADAIVLDLEDAVVPAEKTPARQRLEISVPQVGQGGATVYVRVNSEEDRLFDDAEAAARAGAGGLLVPKTGSAEMLAAIARRLEPIEHQMGRQPLDFVPLVEDAAALLDARSIARFERVSAMALGSEDLATSMGALPTPDVLRMPKLLLHYAAKAEGRRSYGMLRSVADYRDTEGLKAAAAEAKAFGFDGSTCIHPSVVPVLNEVFAPSADEIAWAEKVIAANAEAERSGTGAFLLDGKFIDVPIVERARRTLAQRR